MLISALYGFFIILAAALTLRCSLREMVAGGLLLGNWVACMTVWATCRHLLNPASAGLDGIMAGVLAVLWIRMDGALLITLALLYLMQAVLHGVCWASGSAAFCDQCGLWINGLLIAQILSVLLIPRIPRGWALLCGLCGGSGRTYRPRGRAEGASARIIP